jgi:hypothetical protein
LISRRGAREKARFFFRECATFVTTGVLTYGHKRGKGRWTQASSEVDGPIHHCKKAAFPGSFFVGFLLLEKEQRAYSFLRFKTNL